MNKTAVSKNVANVVFGTSNIAMFNSSEISNHFKVMLMTTAPTRFQVSPRHSLVVSLRSMNFLGDGHTRSLHSVRMRKAQWRSTAGSLGMAGTCYVCIVVIFVIIIYLNTSILPLPESRRGNWTVLLINFDLIFWLVNKTNVILKNCTCVFCSVLFFPKVKESYRHFLLPSSLRIPKQLRLLSRNWTIGSDDIDHGCGRGPRKSPTGFDVLSFWQNLHSNSVTG